MASATLRFTHLFFRRWAGWVTAVLVAASLGLVPLFLQEGEPHTARAMLGVFSLLGIAALWSGFAAGHQLHGLLVRPGTALIPRYRESQVLSAVTLGMLLVAVMVATVGLLGIAWLDALAFAIPAFALGFLIGLTMGIQMKAAVLGFVLGIGSYLNLVSFGMARARESGEPAFGWWDGIDAVWQQLATIALGTALLWIVASWARGMRESAFPFRMRRSSAQNACSELEGSLPEPLMLLLPRFARRRVPPASSPRSMAHSWQWGTMPLTPLGYALIMAPFMLLMVSFGRSDPTPEVFNNAMLFQANGLIVLLAAHTRARLNRELLRPASRGRVLAGLARGFTKELIGYWLWVSLVHVAVHVLLDPAKLTQLGYWGPYVLSLGLITFGAGIGLWLARWTRWSGLVVFLLVWVLAVIIAEILIDGRAPLLPWVLVSAAAFVQIAWLLPLARWSWLRVEAGRS